MYLCIVFKFTNNFKLERFNEPKCSLTYINEFIIYLDHITHKNKLQNSVNIKYLCV